MVAYAIPPPGLPSHAAMRRPWLIAALFALLTVALPAAHAQQQQSVGDMRINIGVATAGWAGRFPQEHVTHPNLGRPGGNHHLLVSLADAKTGAPVADADVRADVRCPDGLVQSKRLEARITDGVPDHSALFDMNEPGLYRITVYVKTPAHAKPLVAKFTWTHPH